MAEQWCAYSPAYRLTLTDPATGAAARIWTIATAQATLATANTVGSAVFTLNDPNWTIWQDLRPSAMNTVFLELQNRHGEWGSAWYGYVDRANQISDPTTGNQVVLTCTSPQKLFDVFYQTPNQAAALSIAYATGVSGTAVLNYVVRAVKFPRNKVLITGNPDSGANTWGAVSAANFINPSQSTWSAVLQGLIADSGLEMFFDEDGNLHWRPLGYLTVPTTPRPVDLADVTHYDVGTGDEGVVTRVEVRYGAYPFHTPPPTVGSKDAASSPYWQAPDAMVSHLGQRILTVVAPWISTNQYGAAHYLAQALGQMYAANVATASIIMAADPLFKLGTVIEVPALSATQGSSLFYVSAITYNLTWGGPWLMILGLTYGRAKGQSFPYLLTPTVPVAPTGPNSGFPANTTIPNINLDYSSAGTSSGGIGRYDQAFALTTDSSVAARTVTVDPSLNIPVGAVIQVWSSFSAKNKQPIGPSATYTVVSPANGAAAPSDGKIHMPSAGSFSTGYVVLIGYGNTDTGTTTSTGTDNVTTSQTSNQNAVPDPSNLSGTSKDNPTSYLFPLQGYTLGTVPVTQEFGPTSFTSEPAMYGYPHFHTGIDLAGVAATPVLSAIPGTITSVGWNQSVDAAASDGSYPSSEHTIYFNGFGYNVSIRAGDITTHYGHMVDGSCPYTALSTLSAAGIPIGKEGSTGNSTGSHLHFGVFDHSKGVWVNPRTYLPKGT